MSTPPTFGGGAVSLELDRPGAPRCGGPPKGRGRNGKPPPPLAPQVYEQSKVTKTDCVIIIIIIYRSYVESIDICI